MVELSETTFAKALNGSLSGASITSRKDLEPYIHELAHAAVLGIPFKRGLSRKVTKRIEKMSPIRGDLSECAALAVEIVVLNALGIDAEVERLVDFASESMKTYRFRYPDGDDRLRALARLLGAKEVRARYAIYRVIDSLLTRRRTYILAERIVKYVRGLEEKYRHVFREELASERKDARFRFRSWRLDYLQPKAKVHIPRASFERPTGIPSWPWASGMTMTYMVKMFRIHGPRKCHRTAPCGG
jgi:hypothetical protein